MRKHHSDADRDEVLATMRVYRNKYIAHLIPDAALIGPSLDEIMTTTTRVNALFQALSFNTENMMEKIGYDDRPSDLDRAFFFAVLLMRSARWRQVTQHSLAHDREHMR